MRLDYAVAYRVGDRAGVEVAGEADGAVQCAATNRRSEGDAGRGGEGCACFAWGNEDGELIMWLTANGGEPAFPNTHVLPGHEPGWHGTTGISIRDYFAAMIIQGLLSSPRLTCTSDEEVSAASYKIADAMINERSKKN